MVLMSAVLVLAAWMVTHVVLARGVFTTERATGRQRWWSLVPFVNLPIGWRLERRKTVVLWALLLAVYGALYVVLTAR